VDHSEPATLELRLVLACAKVPATEKDDAAIRRMLAAEIDWTLFAQTALERGLAALAAHTLARAAPDMVPDDILAVLRTLIAETHARNRDAFDQIARLVDANPTKKPARGIATACAAARRALDANPNDAAAWRTLGRALFDFDRRKAAIASYDRAIDLAPEDAVTWTDRATLWFAMGQVAAALADLDKALALDPRNGDAWTLRARALWASKRLAEAVEASDRALALDPGNSSATRLGIQSRLFACDWRRREDDERRITAGLKAGVLLVSPLNHRALCSSEAEHFEVARLRARAFPPSIPLWRGEIYRHDRIRIAYLSTDFRDHVVADAIAGCFEHHDKARFETTAISLGPTDGSAMRRRLEAAFDRFVDVHALSDAEVAAMLRASEIDIAIDLNGYIGESRTGILARRPAPVQVNYFGYPGTMGVPFIDYIIADPVVIPEEHRVHYSEQVVYLPCTYLPSDRKRPVAANTPSRAEAGLPATGFVFACLNNAFKIGPALFDVWMRLLEDVEHSVLWFLEDNVSTSANLRREAQLRGIGPERLVFAHRTSMAEHMARQQLADLFLDTLPYNAHTTANDALWVGLPVLTCLGSTFPGRVAASALHAVGLPELVTQSLAEYAALALALARDPERLAALKSKLLRARDTAPLFDTARLARDLEAAYTAMWERQQAGLPAASFAVKPRS
jgi:predicted O-linked N-acetylglucosamine transferase (SPINDLY family)